jgi:acyl-CoA synthetase (AMP-forming)/AMP-acid ligase II
MIAAGTLSVFDAFTAAVERWPERPFLNVLAETARAYGIAEEEITYEDAEAEVEALSDALSAAGYRAGQRVMLLLENRPAFFLWFLACNARGLSVVPVNPDLREAELSYMIDHAEPVLAITTAERTNDLRRAALTAGRKLPVITLQDDPPRARIRDTVAQGQGADAEAALLYTSGTTGQPKGCILTNTYFLEEGRWYADVGGLCEITDRGERMLTPLPIFHMNAMACSFMGMMAVGGCLTVLDRFHPKTWWDAVVASDATCLHYLGVMPSILMNLPETAGETAHAVRFGFGAGGDPKLHAGFEDRFGFPLVEAWAMTETGAGATISANKLPRKVGQSCLGQLPDVVEAQIVAEDGSTGDGPGELLVRRRGDDPRRGFFAGYFKNAEATEEAWQGGWFHTGDIVRRDADGDFFFVDRKKNVIRRAGENIAAVEVESVLMRHPMIAQAGVAAVPDDIRGDEVMALLVVSEAIEPKEIIDWALTQMAYYKVPGYIAFVEALPVTATQKVQRKVLKEQAAEVIGAKGTFDARPLKKRQST